MAIQKRKTAAEFRSQKHRKVVYPSLSLVINTFVLNYLLVHRRSLARVAYGIQGRYLEEREEHKAEDHLDWAMKTIGFRDEEDEPHFLAPLPHDAIHIDPYVLDQPSTGDGSTPPPLPPLPRAQPEVAIDSDSMISTLELDGPVKSEYIATSTDTPNSSTERTTRKGVIKGKKMFYIFLESMKAHLHPTKKRKKASN